jgi:hypothetical protein
LSTQPRSPQARHRAPLLTRAAVGGLATLACLLLPAGCDNGGGAAELRQEIARLQNTLQERNDRLVAQQATIDTLQQRLQVARSISEDDLKRIFYPERIEIDRITGGADYDGEPGDDGVTVYFRPIDGAGDTIKVAGDVRIQIFDLAADPADNLVGEYFIPVDRIGALWHSKLLASHYAVKCPFPKGPPANRELTVRLTFVDYLTQRVVSAQRTCEVALPPR